MSEGATSLRLHPATLAIGALRRLPELVFGIPAAAYFLGDIDLWIAILIAAAGFVISVLLSAIWWFRFSYQTADEQLVIESGVFSRNRRTIPFDRIQDVSLEQSLLARIFNVSIVRVETGGSAGDEGKLECVSRKEADRLRDVIRQHRSGVAGAGLTQTADDEAEAPALFRMEFGRLLTAGLFNFSLVFLAVLGAAWQSVGIYIPIDLPGQIFDPEYWLGEGGQDIANVFSIIAAFGAVAALFVIGMVSGLIRTILRDFGFLLTRTETGLRRVRGLLTKTDVVMPLRRVQAVVLSTGIIRRLFGWHALSLQSLGTDGDAGANHVAVPFAKLPELAPVLEEIKMPPPPLKDQFTSVSRRFITRSWFEDGIALVAITIGVSIFWSWGPVLLLIAPLLIVAPVFQYRAHGYYSDEARLFVRKGVWKPRIVILPLNKIQTLTMQRSLMQRGFGTSTLIIGTAGGSVTSPLSIKDMNFAKAENTMQLLLEQSGVIDPR